MTNPTSNALLRALKSRLRQAGAVALEGVIVIVMMTSIMIGVMFMRKMFSGKLLTMTAARADAWQYALEGCDSGNESKLYEKLHDKSKDPKAAVCPDPKDCSASGVEGLADDGSTTPPPDWFPNGAAQEGNRSLTVTVNAMSRTLTTVRKFSCNEKPAALEMHLGSLDLLSSVVDTAKKIPEEEVKEDTTAQRCMRQGLVGHWWEVDCKTDSNYKCYDGSVNCCVTAGPACFGKREDVHIDAEPDETIH